MYYAVLGKERAIVVVHVELNSWVQAEEHFRDLDQDQGRKHYDRDMFNLSLLTGFYEERQTPLPCRLVIQADGIGSYILVNQGAIVGLLSDQETLRAYQDEFRAFGEYLKSIWE